MPPKKLQNTPKILKNTLKSPNPPKFPKNVIYHIILRAHITQMLGQEPARLLHTPVRSCMQRCPPVLVPHIRVIACSQQQPRIPKKTLRGIPKFGGGRKIGENSPFGWDKISFVGLKSRFFVWKSHLVYKNHINLSENPINLH